MKLFTSDLDRTLIFSERTKLAGHDYECIEQLDGRNISYISDTTRTLLTQLAAELEFVPVTTRSYKQYLRLPFFHEELQPHIAIIANGGIILRQGVVDSAWQQLIAKQMDALPVALQQLPQQFTSWFTADFVVRVNEMDALFFVLIVDAEKLASEQLTQFQHALQQVQWTCYLQGKKLYVLPQFLTKGAAVRYIKRQKPYVWHAAAGDSVMDVSMLELADACFIPAHAELAKSTAHGLPIMKETSSDFTEACLRHILETI